MFNPVAAGEICGVQQHDAKDDRNGAPGDVQSNHSSGDRAYGGCGLQKHADANVGVAFAHIRGRRAGRGRDHGNKRRANGVADVHMEQQRQHRHYHHAAAQARQRSQKSGKQRT